MNPTVVKILAVGAAIACFAMAYAVPVKLPAEVIAMLSSAGTFLLGTLTPQLGGKK